jgi:hypothetical protein
MPNSDWLVLWAVFPGSDGSGGGDGECGEADEGVKVVVVVVVVVDADGSWSCNILTDGIFYNGISLLPEYF